MEQSRRATDGQGDECGVISDLNLYLGQSGWAVASLTCVTDEDDSGDQGSNSGSSRGVMIMVAGWDAAGAVTGQAHGGDHCGHALSCLC